MRQTNAQNLDYAQPLATSFFLRAGETFFFTISQKIAKTNGDILAAQSRLSSRIWVGMSVLARLLRFLATPRLARNHRIKFDRGRAWRAENRQLDLMLIVV